MAYYDINITGTKNELITISLNDLFYNVYDPNLNIGTNLDDQYRFYEVNVIAGNFINKPSWITIIDSNPVSTLNYPFPEILNFSTFTDKLINSTDYLKEIQIVPPSIGTFTIQFYLIEIFYQYGIWGIQNPRVATITLKVNDVEDNIDSNYNTYDRVIVVERNVNKQISFGTDGLYPNGEKAIINTALPAWITNNTSNSYTNFFSITAPTINEYTYKASIYLNDNFKGKALIRVIVVESLYEEIDNCCSDENINIVWLNRQGGRANYIFSQRKDFNVEIGDKKTYINNDIKKYSEINKVYYGTKVYATGLTLNQIDYLDTLRYSIQAWILKGTYFVPILLDISSFDKYNTKENMYEISLSFIYAEQINIQRQ